MDNQVVKTTCHFSGETVDTAIVPLDVVIREIQETSFDSIFFYPTWPWKEVFFPTFPDRVKWILGSTSNLMRTETRDSHPSTIQTYATFPFQYSLFPSMLKTDRQCIRRIHATRKCSALVGGVASRLAFGEVVHFDPACDEPGYPRRPMGIQLPGADLVRPEESVSSTTTTPIGSLTATLASLNRQKRQFVAIAICGVALLMGELAEGGATYAIDGELDYEIGQFEQQADDKFREDEGDLQALGGRLDELGRIGSERGRALVQSIRDIIRKEHLRAEEQKFRQAGVDGLRQDSLMSLDVSLRALRVQHVDSMAQLEVGKLVVDGLRGLAGREMFDATGMYESKIHQGNLYLRNYAQKRETLLTRQQAQNRKDANESLTIFKQEKAKFNELATDQAVLLSLEGQTVYVDVNSFTHPDINVQFNSSFLDGFGAVGHFLTNTVKGVGGFIRNTAKELLGGPLDLVEQIGIGLAATAAAAFLLCCLIQHHPRLTPLKRVLPKTFRFTRNIHDIAYERKKLHTF